MKINKILKKLFLIGFITILLLVVGFIIFASYAMDGHEKGTPSSIAYHDASDLQKATGVEFPEVIPVDSIYYIDLYRDITTIKFVAKSSLSKDFFKRLDKACKTDTCCWRKDEEGFHYFIIPNCQSDSLDRTKGTHWRMTELDGKKVQDWDGQFVEVYVPLNSDTITMEYGDTN